MSEIKEEAQSEVEVMEDTPNKQEEQTEEKTELHPVEDHPAEDIVPEPTSVSNLAQNGEVSVLAQNEEASVPVPESVQESIAEEVPKKSTRKSTKKSTKKAVPKKEEAPEENLVMGTGSKEWYIIKVQVNREDKIKQNLERRIQLANLGEYFEDILVPTTKEMTRDKNGKQKVVSRKLYPGYLMVRMEITDETWYLIRETSGIGDFTGAGGKPVPMPAHEVQRILQEGKKSTDEAPKLKIPYGVGEKVKIVDGAFKGVEGEVTMTDDVAGRVTVSITMFSRSTPVDLEYWQAEKVVD